MRTGLMPWLLILGGATRTEGSCRQAVVRRTHWLGPNRLSARRDRAAVNGRQVAAAQSSRAARARSLRVANGLDRSTQKSRTLACSQTQAPYCQI